MDSTGDVGPLVGIDPEEVRSQALSYWSIEASFDAEAVMPQFELLEPRLLLVGNIFFYDHLYDEDGTPLKYQRVLEYLEEARFADLTEVQQETAVQLCQEWHGTLQELVATARDL